VATGNVVVATFTDTGLPEVAAPDDYVAYIDWGDGTTSTGTITGPDDNGVFTVTDNHTYTASGSYTISVTLIHETAPPLTVTDTANVDVPPDGGGGAAPGGPGVFTQPGVGQFLGPNSAFGTSSAREGAGTPELPLAYSSSHPS